ncbi:DUF2798 domain-containing protein [Vibrio ostreicida]|nr:DUF2798 domain-containing protein [Vibrio ostreicida]NPD09849.1 DUF2798 domain-containing protein [Vibrio ostreicida]
MKQRVVFTVIMSFFLSSLMTLWVTYLNLGNGPEFLRSWGQAFLFAWPAAGVISFLLSPVAHRLTIKVLM